MIIMKFGGSSVRDSERIRAVTEIVKSNLDKKPVLVFSALGSTTDDLIESGRLALEGKVSPEKVINHHLKTAEELGIGTEDIDKLFKQYSDLLKGISMLGELSPKTSDHLVSFGERLSVRMISAWLNSCEIPARFFDGWDAGVITDSNFQNAEVLPETYDKIGEALKGAVDSYGYTPVITGFLGSDVDGSITTLGRGGSDLTASLIGAGIGAEEIQVWKDVDGILSTDPRIVSSAHPLHEISFKEAAELAYFGAKVLHPSSMKPAMLKDIPVRVKNSYNPDHPGTVILKSVEESEAPIKAITYKRNITLVDICSSRMLGQSGFLAHVFEVFGRHGISIDMVATSEVSISTTLDSENGLEAALEELKKVANVSVSREKAILTLICNIKRSSTILDLVFRTLSNREINVQMISQGASKVNIGLIVENSEIEDCIKDIHECFFGKKAA